MNRKYGLREGPDPAFDLASLRLAQAEPPKLYTMEAHVPTIFDQEGTGTCAVQVVSMGGWVCLVRDGVEASPPSRLWLYRLAKEVDREPKEDNGTSYSSIFQAVRALGFPTEEQLPWDVSRVNDPVGGDARFHAADQTDGIEEYSITTMGAWRADQIRRTLASGHPIAAGAWVDAEFEVCRNWNPLRLDGASLGGHGILLIGYDEDGVQFVNSWGSRWGFGGLARIAWGSVDLLFSLRAIARCAKATT